MYEKFYQNQAYIYRATRKMLPWENATYYGKVWKLWEALETPFCNRTGKIEESTKIFENTCINHFRRPLFNPFVCLTPFRFQLELFLQSQFQLILTRGWAWQVVVILASSWLDGRVDKIELKLDLNLNWNLNLFTEVWAWQKYGNSVDLACMKMTIR